MNPYEPPKQASDKQPEFEKVAKEFIAGRPCDFCGSANTGEDKLSRVPPNPILILFGGWIFILIRTAFSKKTDLCRDCGQLNIYKTTGSKIALVILVIMTALTAVAILGEA